MFACLLHSMNLTDWQCCRILIWWKLCLINVIKARGSNIDLNSQRKRVGFFFFFLKRRSLEVRSTVAFFFQFTLFSFSLPDSNLIYFCIKSFSSFPFVTGWIWGDEDKQLRPWKTHGLPGRRHLGGGSTASTFYREKTEPGAFLPKSN